MTLTVQGLHSTKRLTLLGVKGNSCLIAWLKRIALVFCCLGLKLKHQLLLGLEPTSLWTDMPSALLMFRPLESDWNYTIGSPGSPACWLQILGLFSLHNHVSQFLILTLSLYTHIHTHTHILLVLFLLRTLIHHPIPRLQNSSSVTRAPQQTHTQYLLRAHQNTSSRNSRCMFLFITAIIFTFECLLHAKDRE